MERETFDRQFLMFKEMAQTDSRFQVKESEQDVHLGGDTGETDICFPYMLHCAWAARILAGSKPELHIDIGSYHYFIALVSAFIPMVIMDIQTVPIYLPNVTYRYGDLMSLPMADNTVQSLSCMHTVEHIGLGRYGDRLDPQGDIVAARELTRVLKPGGQLLVVEPLNQKSRVQFNSCRLYSYEQVLALFPKLRLKSFDLIKGKHIIANAKPDQVITHDWPHNDTGCFVFTKD